MAIEYTKNWTRHYGRTADACLKHLAGTPLNYLEIGLFEGRSMRMMMENVLTHPDCKAWGVDPWTIESMNRRRYPDSTAGHARIGEVESKARANLFEFDDKLTLVKARSQEFLASMPFNKEFFDITYIDGIHKVYGCLEDTVMCWPLLKVGGYCVWDDYSKNCGVPIVVDRFLEMIPGEYEVAHKGGQLAVKKLKPIDW